MRRIQYLLFISILQALVGAILLTGCPSYGDDDDDADQSADDDAAADDDATDDDSGDDDGNAGLTASDSGLFFAEFAPDPDPPVLGDNSLGILLHDADANPVAGAALTLEPFMPEHGHGSSATPAVSEQGDGHYLATSIVYQMMGEWELIIDVEADGKSDRFVLTYSVE